MGTFVTNPMDACGEFLFIVRELMRGKSEYGNKVSRHYTIYTVKVDKPGKVG